MTDGRVILRKKHEYIGKSVYLDVRTEEEAYVKYVSYKSYTAEKNFYRGD